MQIELNIGLLVEGTDNNATARAERAAQALRLLAETTLLGHVHGRIAASVYEHEGEQVAEPTLIVKATVRGGESRARARVFSVIYRLAARLRQDCIAVLWIEGNGAISGELVGPRAHEWGAFDPGSFTRYDEPAEERAA